MSVATKAGAYQSGIKFGTDGWRALIADQFTFANVRLVASGVAHYLLRNFGTSRPIVIGYDTRFLAREFALQAAEILQSFGFSILLTEKYTPTPIVAFSARHLNSCGALMFTASHNPPQYCGIKFIPDYAGPATPEITNALLESVEEVYLNPSLLKGTQQGSLTAFSPFEDYLVLLRSMVKFDLLKSSGLKVMYDPMYGAGQGYLDWVIREEAGLPLVMLHEGLDPYFGGRIPEPKDDWLPELLSSVPAQKMDLGIANDGDADRFGLVDETGAFVSANEALPLLLRYLYTHRGFRGSTVRTVATSMLLDCVANHLGVTVHETPVGFKYVGEWMRKEPVIVGGEESGGLSVLGHIPEKDGILACLLMMEMCAVEKKPLSHILKDLKQEVNMPLKLLSENLHVEDAKKQELMQWVKSLSIGDSLAGKSIQRIDTTDGVKLYFDQYEWMLLRPSGTEPILRLYGESPDAERTQAFLHVVSEKAGPQALNSPH